MRNFILILISVFMCSCQRSIQDKIINIIQQNGQKDSCVITIANLTSFDWEKVYFFNTNAGLDEINRRLGFEYPYFEDVANRIIFTKSKEVVYHEEEYPDPDKKSKLEFIFENDTTNSMAFTKKTAVFVARKKNFCGWIYYELKPKK